MAWEIVNRVVALALLEVQESTPSIIQNAGVASFLRTAVGVYTLQLEQPVAPTTTAVMAVPMGSAFSTLSGAAQPDGSIVLEARNPTSGTPEDCPLFALCVLQTPIDLEPSGLLPPVAPPLTPTGVLQQIYVSIANGDDGNSGASPADPVATVQAVIDRFPTPPRAGFVFHLDSGIHPNWSFPVGWGQEEPIIMVGDGAGQPGDDGFSELQAPEASQAGSTTTVVVTSGGAVSAWLGKTLEVTSGAAVGSRRSINRVDGVNLHVPRAINGFVAGDSYRVVEPGASVAEKIDDSVPVCLAMGAPPAPVNSASSLGALSGAYIAINLFYLNPTGRQNSHERSLVFGWGIDTDAPGVNSFVCPSSWVGFGWETIGISDLLTLEQVASFVGQIGAAAPQSAAALVEMWGSWSVRLASTQFIDAAWLAGYLVGVGGTVTMQGGNLLGGGGTMNLNVRNGTNNLRCGSANSNSWWCTGQLNLGAFSGESNVYLEVAAFGTVSWRRAGGPAVLVQKSAFLSWVQNNAALAEIVSTGGVGLQCQDGGRAVIEDTTGATVISGAAGADLQVDNTGPFALATIAAPGAAHTNGATSIQRAI